MDFASAVHVTTSCQVPLSHGERRSVVGGEHTQSETTFVLITEMRSNNRGTLHFLEIGNSVQKTAFRHFSVRGESAHNLSSK